MSEVDAPGLPAAHALKADRALALGADQAQPGPPPLLQLTSGPITPVQLALFAAASGDHNPLHLDPNAARASGFDRPLVHGMLTMALVGRLFTQAFGHGCVRRLNTRFEGTALVHESLTFSAELASMDAHLVTYSIRGTSSSGTVIVNGSAQLHRPAVDAAASAGTAP